MSPPDAIPAAQTFFLNERHELSRAEKPEGGRTPNLAPIDWASKGQHIGKSLASARAVIEKSKDPLRDRHLFLGALPEKLVKKISTDKKRAPEGFLDEPVDYGGTDSVVFRRLGLDLLAVSKDGTALVHAPSTELDRLQSTTTTLASEGKREQARWVAISSFIPAPTEFRVDNAWLAAGNDQRVLDAVLELQPMLSRVEVEEVLRAVRDFLGPTGDSERFTRSGTDFSGRHWYRGMLRAKSVRQIAESFYSVQSLHAPLQSPITLSARGSLRVPTGSTTKPVHDPALLPAVGVVDVGVPSDHRLLGRFRRGAFVGQNTPTGVLSDHGSRVASRVVFGDPDFFDGPGATPPPECSFYDVNVAADAHHIEDKDVLTALEAVVATAPDVRVFNLSFGSYAALDALDYVQRQEKLALLQDLDNFIFRSDVLVVVAAGNSRPGVQPAQAYPAHVDDPTWALGSWASGFNSLVCGSYVARLAPGGLVQNLGWPSAFTRVGPSHLANAPVPGFAASGGNCDATYRSAVGLGVFALDAAGTWADECGTSLAAPLLAREAALALAELQRHCEHGTRPFAATAKAFLTLTARSTGPFGTAAPLASRTLGHGVASHERLAQPESDSAVLIWQGVLEGADDLARVQIPIPAEWIREAGDPALRVVTAWDTPANAATPNIWGSRKVEARLRPFDAERALRGSGAQHRSHPMSDRAFSLKRKDRPLPVGDSWLLEVSYREIAAYAMTLDFSPRQRVGVALQLVDRAEQPVSPQGLLQGLPIAPMNRLSMSAGRSTTPVVVRSRA